MNAYAWRCEMKNKLIIALLLSCMLILGSCGSTESDGTIKSEADYVSWDQLTHQKDENEFSADKLNQLLDAVEARDSEAVSALFAENSRTKANDFEASVKELLEYYKGTAVLAPEWENITNSGDGWDGPIRNKFIDISFVVTTSECKYRVSMYWTDVDTGDRRNEGINSFYIIRFDDDINIDCPYSGDGKDTPGINIGVQNTWANGLIDDSDY